MKRTKATPTVQAGLFDSHDVYALADQVARLEKHIVKLDRALEERTKWYENAARERDRLWRMHAEDPTHPAAKENIRLKREVERLRQDLRQWILSSPATSAGGLTKGALTKLLTVVHPDKWQNQPAEKLAHEVTILVNQWRGEVQA